MVFRTNRSWWRVWLALWIVGWGWAGVVRGSEPPPARDTLVYKDGDRVQGTVLREDQSMIVFKSDRFGELRVPATDAVVIKGTPAPDLSAAASPIEAKSPETVAEEEKASKWEWFSASQLTARLRNFFGPWHGRVAISTEVVSDAADRNSQSFDLTLRRKWTRDELQLTGRYEYAESNRVNTTDTIRGSGMWRHDFSKRYFAQYRPQVEWDRASFRSGVPNDYVLLQQEIGVGVVFISTPTRKARLGVSQNRFDVWNSAPTAEHTSRGAQSLFEEIDFALPWRMTISQRGNWYPVPNQRDGWDNRVELSKKLTETLNASIRHEVRRNNPDGSSQNYTRLRLLLGVDF